MGIFSSCFQEPIEENNNVCDIAVSQSELVLHSFLIRNANSMEIHGIVPELDSPHNNGMECLPNIQVCITDIMHYLCVRHVFTIFISFVHHIHISPISGS